MFMPHRQMNAVECAERSAAFAVMIDEPDHPDKRNVRFPDIHRIACQLGDFLLC